MCQTFKILSSIINVIDNLILQLLKNHEKKNFCMNYLYVEHGFDREDKYCADIIFINNL